MPQVISRSLFVTEASPGVVGAISAPDTLQAFASASAQDQIATCDLAELRVDLIGLPVEEIRRFAESIHVPLLITARHPEEGGRGSPIAAERAALIAPLLDLATAIDIELRSLPELRELAQQAQQQGVTVIGSFHNFEATPDAAALSAILTDGLQKSVDLVKIAVRLHTAQDLLSIADILATAKQPLSIMGMGELGKVSRLLLAKLGSRLNYGFIGSANAPGQWPARELKQLVAQL